MAKGMNQTMLKDEREAYIKESFENFLHNPDREQTAQEFVSYLEVYTPYQFNNYSRNKLFEEGRLYAQKYCFLNN